MFRLTSLLWFCFHLAYGQHLEAKLWRDSIPAAPGSTFTNQIVIRNTSGQPLTVRLRVACPSSIQLFSALPHTIYLQAGEIHAVPLKGMLSLSLATASERVSITLTDTTGSVMRSMGFVVAALEKVQAALLLTTPKPAFVLYSPTEPLVVSLRLIHQRLRAVPYRISVQSIPTGVDERTAPLPITLTARQDTLIQLRLRPRRAWSVNHPYQIALTVRDTSGSIVGTLLYRLIVATVSKQMAPLASAYTDGYGASVAVNKLSNNQFSTEGRIWGIDSLGRGQVSFAVHYTDYIGTTYRQLQQAYVAYRTQKAIMQLGSIYDYHELALFGWGAKVQLDRPTHQWSFWAIQNNPDWFEPFVNRQAGAIASARYTRPIPNRPSAFWSVSTSYFTQTSGLRAGYLNYATLQFSRPGGHSVNVLVGQSLEYARRGADRALTPGYAAQFNYTYDRPRLRLQWQSYVSSPAYAGLQRGATLLNGQLAWHPTPHTSLLTRLYHVQYQPLRFLSATESYQTSFGNTIAEVNLSRRFRLLGLTLRPYWHRQLDQTNPFSQQAHAWRVAGGFSYQSRRSQLTGGYDVGWLTDRSALSVYNGGPFFSQRITSSINLGTFGLWGYWQRGPYYLYDFRGRNPGGIVTMSITPMVSFAAFQQRLQATAGLTYLRDGLFNRVQYVTVGRLKYNITPNCWIRLEGNGTPYSQQEEYAYSQYRLEFTKLFGSPGRRQRGSLQLSFFQDTNGNGQFDSGERWVDSLLVTVNDQTLLTNARGTIRCSNLPLGPCVVSAISADRGNLKASPIFFNEKFILSKTINRTIPLRRTFQVSGRIQCQSRTYDRNPCHLDRFVVHLYQDGKRQAFVPVLPDGTFTGHWVPGDYLLEIHDTERLMQPVVKRISFTLTDKGDHPLFDWVLDGAIRDIEVQRFKAD